MKKNIMMRLSALLLVAVLLTTCVISGTFAKYTTADSATDTARVAKWGVSVTVIGNDAFGELYDDEINVAGTKVVSVKATDDDVEQNVVAPGTRGTLGSVVISGTPEVMVDVAVSLDIELEGWEIDGVYYCPLQITKGTTTLSGLDYLDADAFEAAIEALVNKTGDNVAANTDLGTTYDVVLNWEWLFETGADAAEKAANNIKDTKLADLATAPTITTTWNASVEQVD